MLTDKQKKAVEMLFSGEKVQDTAEALGVHRSTIWRWSKTRDFRREIARLERNKRRRLERLWVKLDAEAESFWNNRLREAEENLQRESAKIKTRPGRAALKAWNEYEKALFMGMSLDELFDMVTTGKIKRRKLRRLREAMQHNRA